ncbi:MAG: ParA family protein [Emticicia sp.]|nr:ParA family protein [Emticicia sp.]
MRIITLSHQKGGVGKTTLALNLAACFKNGLKVAILDTDLQGSLSGIAPEMDGFDFIPADRLNDINTLSTQYDILIIDTPPYLMDTLPMLFSISDYVLVPSKVGFFDVMAIRSTLEILKLVMVQKPNLKFGVVLNMIKSRTSINDDIKKILESYGAPVLKTTVSDRVSYTRSSITNGVFSSDDQKAKDEIIALANEILNDLGL